MSQKLIDHNQDFRRLREAGFVIEIRSGHLLIHEIPYVNAARQIRYGILVSDLSSMAGDTTVSPIEQHIAYFIGEHPCNSDGSIISGIRNASQNQLLAPGLQINHTFSSKPTPPEKYLDYFHKMSTYALIISSPAQALDNTVTERPFKLIASEEENSVFNYYDTNSVKAKINIIAAKLEDQVIGVVGAGGTGSYVIDFLAKTPIKDLHIFDGDLYMQHNAFRSPGAPSIEELMQMHTKAEYFQSIYSKMRKNIIAHNYYIDASNVAELNVMSFVFLCMDKGDAKKIIIEYLVAHNIPFIDTGIGILNADDSLIGHIRTTTFTSEKRDHISQRISFAEGKADDQYATNIQIAELNAINAAFAVIKWKKVSGFYQDLGKEFNTTYSINDGILINEDHST